MGVDNAGLMSAQPKREQHFREEGSTDEENLAVIMKRMKNVLSGYKQSTKAMRSKCDAQEREILRLCELLAKNNIQYEE